MDFGQRGDDGRLWERWRNNDRRISLAGAFVLTRDPLAAIHFGGSCLPRTGVLFYIQRDQLASPRGDAPRAVSPIAKRKPSPEGLGEPQADRAPEARHRGGIIRHSFSNNHVHVVHSTKTRVDRIPPQFENRLYSFIAEIARSMESHYWQRMESPIIVIYCSCCRPHSPGKGDQHFQNQLFTILAKPGNRFQLARRIWRLRG